MDPKGSLPCSQIHPNLTIEICTHSKIKFCQVLNTVIYKCKEQLGTCICTKAAQNSVAMHKNVVMEQYCLMYTGWHHPILYQCRLAFKIVGFLDNL
jgi:hypothetical protein